MSKSIEFQIGEILDSFSEEVKAKSEAISNEVAKECAEKLKASSPKKTGEYASGWSVIKKGHASVVYNKKKPQITQLLEYGHAKKNQYGAYGMTPAHPHIKSVEEWGCAEFEQRVKDGI